MFSEEDKIFMKQGEIKLRLTVKKRKYQLSFKDNKERLEQEMNDIRNIENFHNKFEVAFHIRKGDISVVQFCGATGNELHGKHFVVALSDSKQNNPLVTVVPLKSLKNVADMNPASDVLLGHIAGILNGKQAVAVINQIKVIDKARFFEQVVLGRAESIYSTNAQREGETRMIQYKNVYRLTNDQFKILLKAVVGFISCGFISH